ncbi:hypothetical protein B0H14DRAFT_3432330 [Mycena olivaceomarginata]|nr:hypothetical protein B0H14DRAFT_3432330 [Mycena olivaceomarginata]
MPLLSPLPAARPRCPPLVARRSPLLPYRYPGFPRPPNTPPSPFSARNSRSTPTLLSLSLCIMKYVPPLSLSFSLPFRPSLEAILVSPASTTCVHACTERSGTFVFAAHGQRTVLRSARAAAVAFGALCEQRTPHVDLSTGCSLFVWVGYVGTTMSPRRPYPRRPFLNLASTQQLLYVLVDLDLGVVPLTPSPPPALRWVSRPHPPSIRYSRHLRVNPRTTVSLADLCPSALAHARDAYPSHLRDLIDVHMSCARCRRLTRFPFAFPASHIHRHETQPLVGPRSSYTPYSASRRRPSSRTVLCAACLSDAIDRRIPSALHKDLALRASAPHNPIVCVLTLLHFTVAFRLAVPAFPRRPKFDRIRTARAVSLDFAADIIWGRVGRSRLSHTQTCSLSLQLSLPRAARAV